MNGPDYVIAGASKSGTTWVAHCLKEHPEVCIPLRELNFFSHNYDRGWGWYADQFKCEREGDILVEKSPSYMTDVKVPDRLKSAVNEIKVIFIIRDPVSRAYSDYCMKYKRGEATGDIDTELKKRSEIIENGMYHKYIKKYIDKLGRGKIKVMIFEDLKKNNKKFIYSVQEELGVNNKISPSLIGKKVNKSKSRPIFKSIDMVKRKMLKRVKGISPVTDRAIKWAVNGWPSTLYNRLNRSRSEPPRMGGELKKIMADLYRPDVKKMSTILDKDLEDIWLSKYDR